MTDGAVPKLLSVGELAERLGVSVTTIYTWTCRGRLPHVKVGRRVLFDPRAIEAWLAERARPDVPARTRWRRRRRRREQTPNEATGSPQPVQEEVRA